MKQTLQTLPRRVAAMAVTLLAAVLAATPAAAAVEVDPETAVMDHANILSADTEDYINSVSQQLSDACGAQIGVYSMEELLGNSTMEGYAYDVYTAWGIGSSEKDNGVLLLLAPNEPDGGEYYLMRGTGLETQLSISTLSTIVDENLEPDWAAGNYDDGTRKTVEALANRLCSIYGVTLDTSETEQGGSRTGGGFGIMGWILVIFAVILVVAVIGSLMRPRGGFFFGGPRPPRRRRTRRPPPPRGGPGGFDDGPYGGRGGRGGFDDGPYGGPRGGQPSRRSGGGSRMGGPSGGFGGSGPMGGSGRSARPSGSSRPSGGARSSGGSRSSGGFRMGGGTTRGGGVGRHR